MSGLSQQGDVTTYGDGRAHILNMGDTIATSIEYAGKTAPTVLVVGGILVFIFEVPLIPVVVGGAAILVLAGAAGFAEEPSELGTKPVPGQTPGFINGSQFFPLPVAPLTPSSNFDPTGTAPKNSFPTGGGGYFELADSAPDKGDPLLLDLNGDGIKTTNYENAILFDHDNNGFAELTNWVDANDGILAVDKDSNGTIDNGNEIFGDNTALSGGGTATDGYQALADYDSNLDGVVDINDLNFAQLRILKGDGTLITLAEAGITSLSLANTQTNTVDENGNTQVALGSYTKTDGTTAQMGDYNFLRNSKISEPITLVTIPEEIGALPKVLGTGNVYNLQDAMALDTSGDLQDLVEAFIASTNTATQNGLLDQILSKWTGVAITNEITRGGLMLDTHAYIMEEFQGRQFDRGVGGASEFIGTVPAGYLSQGYYALAENLYGELMAQTQLKDYFDATYWEWNAESEGYNYNISAVTQMIETLAVTNESAAIQAAAQFSRALSGLGLIPFSNYLDFYQAMADLGNDFQFAIDTAEKVIVNGSSSDETIGSAGSGTWDEGSGHQTQDTRALYLDGKAGNDTLQGTYGDDIFVGGTGNDSLVGHQGNDTYIFNAGDGQDIIREGNSFLSDTLDGGLDTIVFGAGITANDLSFSEGSTAEDLVISINDGSNGQITIVNALDSSLGDGNVEYLITGDGTVIDTANLLATAIINGTSSADNLTGTRLGDVMNAGDGDDTLNGGFGSDSINAGMGNDTVDGDVGNDIINGEDGDDSLYGGDGNDTLDGGSGNDTLDGVNGSNHLIGGAGDDYLTLSGPAPGHNILEGGIGNDTIYGGSGNDIYRFNLGDGQDEINDSQGLNVIEFGAGITEEDLIFSNGPTNSLQISIANTSDSMSLYNELDDNTVSIKLSDNTIITNAQIMERLQVLGTSGDDSLSGSDYAENLLGGAGNDYIYSGHGNDTVEGGDGDDDLSGGTGNGQYFGQAGNDSLSSGDGEDTLAGGLDNDFLSGGSGNDTYVFNLGDGQDEINDAEGLNFIEFGAGIAEEDLIFSNGPTNSLQISIANTSDSMSLYNALDGNTVSIKLNDDTIITNAQIMERLQVLGTSGDDSLSGSDYAENLLGGAGNDYIYSGHGNDTVEGGDGDDELSGGTGNGQYFGQAGSDSLSSGDGQDTLVGGLDNDFLSGGSGNDTYMFNLGDGQDEINDSEGLNVIEFGAGIAEEDLIFSTNYFSELTVSIANTSDAIKLYSASTWETFTIKLADNTIITSNDIANRLQLLGTTADDTLQGSDYAETYWGKAGNDYLFGEGGDDTLYGGSGNDTIYGGLGNDTYVLDTINDSVIEYSNEGTDTVQAGFSYTLGSDVENLTLTGTGSHTATGNTLNNVLTANTGNNTLTGGAGDDIYRFNNNWGTDSIADSAGTDTADLSGVSTNLTINLVAGTGNEILSGVHKVNWTSNIIENATGGSGNDSITGNTGNNILIGGTGNDTMVGGTGNDTYGVNATGDVVTEAASAGTDTVQASLNYTLGTNVENLILTGVANLTGTGNTLNNFITGNGGNNTLDGGTGNDTLIGGLGNDTLVVNAVGDVVTENGDEGIDTVQASISYTLGNHVENLTLTGATNLTGKGNTLNNLLIGNTGNNSLTGAAGNDTLDGGTGNDTLVGGLGDDFFVVNVVGDVITENADGGVDTVQSSISYTLGTPLENLILTGTSNLTGTGNGSDNVLIGNTGNNTLTGGSGHDTLDGGVGTDSLIGGVGDDVYIVDSIFDVVTENASEGTDTVQAKVSYTLGSQLENMTLLGASNINGTGNSLDNTIAGNSGNNILDGAAGNNTLLGGLGNDTYVLNSMADVVTENASEGIDTVQAHFSYSLGDHLENLDLTGSLAINGTGNTLDNFLVGNSGDNSLVGAEGNDTLDGGAGSDTLVGGTGDDVHAVDSVNDIVTELTDEGIDTVQASISYTLGNDVENLTLTGSSDLNGTGNALNNLLTGNSGNNILIGEDGEDTFAGGSGNDTYLINSVGDVAIENASEGTDTVQSFISYTLGEHFENLTLIGAATLNATGNTFDNELIGNASRNILDGGTGNDTMAGGLGDDDYVVDNTNDVVSENADAGFDTVQSSITYTLGANFEGLTLTGSSNINGTGNSLDNYLLGNTGANSLSGGDGNDLLDGGAGNDTLSGGNGDDYYVVESSNDTVSEAADEGHDVVETSVTYSLNANVEDLVLTGEAHIDGTGNSLDNFLYANDGNNILSSGAGNDTLFGGIGNDTLVGGSGDDYYYIDNILDVITEYTSEGMDTVESSVSYTLSNHVENLILTGNEALVGTGNSLANYLTGNVSANSLLGDSGNDTLDGGLGIDTLIGGTGDDTYYVNLTGDLVTEESGEGSDTVISTAAAYSLSSNLENLTLIGNLAFNGTGNSLDNVLTGNSINNALEAGAGNDTLIGATGNDTLQGGGGNDTYIFAQGDGQDIIQDSGNSDTMLFDSSVSLSSVVFYQTGAGELQIGYTNSSGDLITVQGQNNSSTAVERFELSNGQYMSDADVNQILSDMASYAAANSISLTSLDDVKADANLVAIVNGGWQS
ncbi:hypothetical protein [Vampirovibrio sp.]|uniref:calcium-binding protein n=1 Tax=Vampirovibrio sp. TaxID=2717857 RepID=UPI003594036D